MAYTPKESFVPLIYQKKDVLLDHIDDFVLEDFFEILSFGDRSYRYSFSEGMLKIVVEGKEYIYPYQIREPKIETVEKIVYKEVIREKQAVPEKEEQQEVADEEEYEKGYFCLLNDQLSFAKGTAIEEIISSVSEQVDTNLRVTIDYSSLNPNQIGQYEVIFTTEEGKHRLFVTIV